MKSFLFKLRYVYRNITRNPFRTISLFLTIMMLSFIFLCTYTVHDALSEGFYLYENNSVDNVDIYVTFDQESSSHIIDSSKMKSLYEYVDFYSPFFELSTIISHGDESQVTTVLAGSSKDLGNILKKELPYLQKDEIILSSSMANDLKTGEGEEIEVYIADKAYTYKVVKVIEDRSIFSGKVLVDKDYYTKEYAKNILSINMDEMSNIDLATTIYINLRDDIKKENMIQVLKTASFYPNSVVRDPRNYNDMKANIDMVTGIIYAVLVIFAVALSFVLISFVNLRIKGFKKEVGIIETLGEGKTYVFEVFSIEIFVLSILGFIGAFLITNTLYTKEFEIVIKEMGKFQYHFKLYQVLLTILSILIVCSLAIVHSYRKYKKTEVLDLTSNKKYEEVFNMKILIIINVIFGILTLLNWLVFTKFLPMKFTSPFGIVVTSLFGVMMVSLLVKLICKIFRGDKTFKLTFLKNLSVNRIKHNSLKILLISLFGISICLSCIETIEHVLDTVGSSIKIDTVFVNPNGISDEMVEDIESYDAVVNASKGWFERKISTTDNETAFLLVFSCDVEDTEGLMSFTVPEEYHEEFKNPQKSYIIVANDFLLTTDYDIGDTISFNLSDGIHNYIILGGANISGLEFAYTNDYYYEGSQLNVVIIHNDTSNSEAMNEFRVALTQKYGGSLSYIFNASRFLTLFIERAYSALRLIYAIIAFILFCFIISIINNTILNFNEVKNDFAILQILGISPKALVGMIIKEMIISYLAIFLQLVMMVLLVIKYLPGLTLLLGYYVKIIASPTTLIISFVLGILCFIFSYIYYFIGIRKINVSEEIRKDH